MQCLFDNLCGNIPLHPRADSNICFSYQPQQKKAGKNEHVIWTIWQCQMWNWRGFVMWDLPSRAGSVDKGICWMWSMPIQKFSQVHQATKKYILSGILLHEMLIGFYRHGSCYIQQQSKSWKLTYHFRNWLLTVWPQTVSMYIYRWL